MCLHAYVYVHLYISGAIEKKDTTKITQNTAIQREILLSFNIFLCSFFFYIFL